MCLQDQAGLVKSVPLVDTVGMSVGQQCLLQRQRGQEWVVSVKNISFGDTVGRNKWDWTKMSVGIGRIGQNVLQEQERLAKIICGSSQG